MALLAPVPDARSGAQHRCARGRRRDLDDCHRRTAGLADEQDRSSRTRFWSTAAALPLVIPSYIGAVVMVAAFGPRGMLQTALAPLGVERLPSIYGFTGSWLTLTLFTYPYVYLTVRAALRNLDPSLEEAARCLGYGPWRTFFAVTLPQLRPAAAAGGVLTVLYTLGDFGVVTLLRYDAFTRAIYVQYRSALDRGSAALLALLLVAISIAVLAVELRARGNATLHRLGSGASRRGRPIALGMRGSRPCCSAG